MTREYINSDEMMQIFKVSKATVYRWVKAKKLKAEKHLGDSYLWFKRDEVELFMKPKVGRKPKHKGGN